MTDIDYAKRAYDVMMLHVVGKGEDAWGKWVALRLSDGGSDGTLYDTKQDAMRHQLHPSQCCYIIIPPSGFTLREVKRFLDVSRHIRSQGGRTPTHWDYGRRGISL